MHLLSHLTSTENEPTIMYVTFSVDTSCDKICYSTPQNFINEVLVLTKGR